MRQIILTLLIKLFFAGLAITSVGTISHLPGQSSVLHEVEEEDDPEQSAPPFIGPTFDLVWVLVPEPHDLEHELQVPHGVHVHGTEINSNISVGLLNQ